MIKLILISAGLFGIWIFGSIGLIQYDNTFACQPIGCTIDQARQLTENHDIYFYSTMTLFYGLSTFSLTSFFLNCGQHSQLKVLQK